MSMQPPDMRIPRHSRIHASKQSGIGLIQVMLLLLLVGSVLAAGAVLLQSRKAPTQAFTQEQTLRWADEALAAFAIANARLPCPADTVYGEENCSSGRAKGWLPARTLLGASGNGMPLGPVAYMVYRGDDTNHLDLAATDNVYQPPLIDGSAREIITKDEDGNETSRRLFAAINGLDLCRSLELAQAASNNGEQARVPARDGVQHDVAYGIAAAGAQAGPARLDDGNADSTDPRMEAPWREWDSGYDDRVRVRSFDAVGQMLGCRMLADLAGMNAAASAATVPFSVASLASIPPGNTAIDISLTGMDVLAAAVTLHDSLSLLQASNLEAAEAAVDGATKAQISLIFKLVTTAASLSDKITTLVTSAVSLTRAVATCIASLGATCWEVPLKVSAVVTSIVALGEKGVTLAQKAAALVPTALALDASIKARDMARKAAKPPSTNIDEVRKQMECTLYALNCEEPNETKVTYKTDGDGNPIPVRDGDGNPVYDEYGNPKYEIASEITVPRKGLKERVKDAKDEWHILQERVDELERYRLAPWGLSILNTTDSDGKVTYQFEENNLVNARINMGKTISDTCNGKLEGCRYGKRIEKWVCKEVGAGNGEYELQLDNSCKYVGSQTTKDKDGNDVTTKLGTHDHIKEIHYEFDWDLAIQDVIARRRKTQEWAELNLRTGELDEEIKTFQKNYDSWFKGGSSIISKMKNQRDDAQHCSASPKTDMTVQKCINATNAVRYVEHCEKPKVVTQCQNVGGESGYYVDAACTRSSGNDTGGIPLPKVYAWVEISSDTEYERDTNPLATCEPNMKARLTDLLNEKNQLGNKLNTAASAYSALPSPYVEYPNDWFSKALETLEDGNGNIIGYRWQTSSLKEKYWVWEKDNSDPPKDVQVEKTRPLPYYAPEPYNSSGSAPLLVTSNLTLASKSVCPYLTQRYWGGAFWGLPSTINWGNTHKYGLYCERYPLNRAFEDWRRAKDGAEQARQNYLDTEAQFKNLEEKYERLKNPGSSTGGAELAIGFGAESALERADSRGSTGPQRLGSGP